MTKAYITPIATSTGVAFAGDTIGSASDSYVIPHVRVVHGATGVAGTNTTTDNPFPVLAKQNGTWTFGVTGGTATIGTVLVGGSIPAGTATMGTVYIGNSLPAGTATIGVVGLSSAVELGAGTATVGTVILAAGGIVNALNSTASDFRVMQTADNLISTNNSTTTPLGGGAAFTGTGDDCLGYASIAVTLYSDVASATDGMTFQFSTDNSNWDDVYPFTLDAGSTRRFQFPVTARYFRVVYTNGAGAQSAFRVQTILHVNNILTSIYRVQDNIDEDRSAGIMKTILFAKGAGGATDTFIPIDATNAGNLKVAVEEFDTSLPAGTATIGTVNNVGYISPSIAGNTRGPLTAAVTASGSTILVSGVAGQSIYVTGLSGSNRGATVRVAFGPSGDMRHAMNMASGGGGFVEKFDPHWKLATGANLTAVTTDPITADINIQFYVQ